MGLLQQKIEMPIVETGAKTGVGIVGSLATMTINDLVGIVVGVFTIIYLILQIQDILRKRKK